MLLGNVCSSSCLGVYPYEFEGTCVAICGDGTYLNAVNNKCEPCRDPCKTCGTSAFDCLDCISGLYFWNSDTNTCALCNSPCDTCGSDGDDCLSCVQGKNLNGNVCADTCGDLYT